MTYSWTTVLTSTAKMLATILAILAVAVAIAAILVFVVVAAFLAMMPPLEPGLGFFV